MNNSLKVINELLINIFNDILIIEQNALKQGEFKDITITEVHTIEAIGMYEPKSSSEVAKKLKITMGTLSTAVNNLVKKGYVERIKSEYDRRVVMLGLTRKGKLMYRVHDKFHKDLVKVSVDTLSEIEREILIKSLGKLNTFLQANYLELE